MSDQNVTPEVECSGCGRRAECMRMSDGTVYRPFAWAYPDESKPLSGICRGCQEVEALRGNLNKLVG